MGRLFAIAAKLAISAGLIWYAFSKIDVSAAFAQILALAPMAAIAELAVISAHYAVAALRVRRQYCYSSHGSPSKKPESPLAGLLAYHHVRRPGTPRSG